MRDHFVNGSAVNPGKSPAKVPPSPVRGIVEACRHRAEEARALVSQGDAQISLDVDAAETAARRVFDGADLDRIAQELVETQRTTAHAVIGRRVSRLEAMQQGLEHDATKLEENRAQLLKSWPKDRYEPHRLAGDESDHTRLTFDAITITKILIYACLSIVIIWLAQAQLADWVQQQNALLGRPNASSFTTTAIIGLGSFLPASATYFFRSERARDHFAWFFIASGLAALAVFVGVFPYSDPLASLDGGGPLGDPTHSASSARVHLDKIRFGSQLAAELAFASMLHLVILKLIRERTPIRQREKPQWTEHSEADAALISQLVQTRLAEEDVRAAQHESSQRVEQAVAAIRNHFARRLSELETGLWDLRQRYGVDRGLPAYEAEPQHDIRSH